MSSICTMKELWRPKLTCSNFSQEVFRGDGMSKILLGTSLLEFSPLVGIGLINLPKIWWGTVSPLRPYTFRRTCGSLLVNIVINLHSFDREAAGNFPFTFIHKTLDSAPNSLWPFLRENAKNYAILLT